METLKKYWWVFLLIALLIAAYFFREQIIGLFGKKPKGEDVPAGESCASAQRIAQRAALKEGEDDCPKPLYAVVGKAKERRYTKGPDFFDSCMSTIRRDRDGTGPWYFNYEKGNQCYYTNDISNPIN